MQLQKSIDRITPKLAASKRLRSGAIAFRFTGKEGGDYFMHCKRDGGCAVDQNAEDTIHAELIGPSTTLLPIVEGTKDPVRAFVAGGFRVRGDLRYLYDLAYELGILKKPL